MRMKKGLSHDPSISVSLVLSGVVICKVILLYSRRKAKYEYGNNQERIVTEHSPSNVSVKALMI